MSKEKTTATATAAEADLTDIAVYVDPADLTPSQAARPGETPQQFEQRVQRLAASIEQNGQLNPIRIREDEEGKQIIVAGDGRRAALEIVNNRRKSQGLEPLLAWCVIDMRSDSGRRAIVDNFHRENLRPLQIAQLIQQVRAEKKWTNAPGKKGEGANKKLAEYFGILPSEVTQYEKLAAADAGTRERLESGELTMSGALALLKVGIGEAPVVEGAARSAVSEMREKVAEEAKRIAEKEQQKDDEMLQKFGTPEPKPVKVTATHVAKAAAKVANTVIKAPSRSQILEELTALDGPVSSAAGRKFVQEFVLWAEGKNAKDAAFLKAWDALQAGSGSKQEKVEAPKPKPEAVKPAVKKAAAPAKKPAPAAAKKPAKTAAKPAAKAAKKSKPKSK